MSGKPISRDFKRSRRQGLGLGRWREFLYGLGLGLAIAVAVFAWQRNSMQELLLKANSGNRPEPKRNADATASGDPLAAAEPAQQFDFYDRLANFEVLVPEKDAEVQRNSPTAPIDRPGTYVLQAGSYRNLVDAERVRTQLALQGVPATLQRVAVGGVDGVEPDVWHRVRIGPSADLAEVNRLRNKLRSADLDALIIRIGD